jgi:hypothetical protein
MKLFEPGGDLGILSRERRIADRAALDRKRAEVSHVEPLNAPASFPDVHAATRTPADPRGP